MAAFSLAGVLATPVHAFEFELGDFDAVLDTTVSIGGTWRLDDPDPDLYGLSNGGNQFSVNADDGNLNYGSGLVSSAFKVTADLDVSQDSFGFFFRGSAFYDFENEDGGTDRLPLTEQALDKVGRHADFLDAYLWASWDAGDVPVNLRLGYQVLSWGESTFIQNGINTINPIDVSKIRIPGAEVREALDPVLMLSASAGLTPNLSVEGFYQFKWQATEIDPPGTYFSTNDFAGQGGETVWLGFGAIPEGSPFGGIPRGESVFGSDSGNFGIAARLLVPELNDTEFGFYYIRYSSRLPLINAVTPTQAIDTSNLVPQLTLALIQQGLPQAQAAAQASGLWDIVVAFQTLQAAGPGALTPTQLAIVSDPVAQATIASPQTGALIDGAGRIALLQAAATGRYFTSYPDDIDLFGVSFNTDLLRTGISLQGEIAYRNDQPLQVDDVELLYAALSALNPGFAVSSSGQPVNQIGNYFGQLGVTIEGFRRYDVWQGQMTATKVLGPTLGADQVILLAEVGFTHVPDLPLNGELRFDGSGTYTPGQGTADAPGSAGLPREPGDAFADPFSWGYRFVTRLDYNNAFFGMNFSPSLQWAHDVRGNTPLPLGNFQEDRKVVTLGTTFTYLNAWEATFRWTEYFGADRYHLLGDRDFFSATLKYSF